MLVRLVTGCSWVVAEQLCGQLVSDTTLRARRDEWITAGVFDSLWPPRPLTPLRPAVCWSIERTNSWLTNFGQFRRNADRTTRHRHAQLAFAITLLLVAKLIDWRSRWSPIR
jgi:hypothetical protein